MLSGQEHVLGDVESEWTLSKLCSKVEEMYSMPSVSLCLDGRTFEPEESDKSLFELGIGEDALLSVVATDRANVVAEKLAAVGAAERAKLDEFQKAYWPQPGVTADCSGRFALVAYTGGYDDFPCRHKIKEFRCYYLGAITDCSDPGAMPLWEPIWSKSKSAMIRMSPGKSMNFRSNVRADWSDDEPGTLIIREQAHGPDVITEKVKMALSDDGRSYCPISTRISDEFSEQSDDSAL